VFKEEFAAPHVPTWNAPTVRSRSQANEHREKKMKYSARIAALSAIVVLACASQAQAGRRISTDQDWKSTGWNNASYLAPRTELGNMELNALGANPLKLSDLLSFDFGDNADFIWFSKFKPDIDEDDPDTSADEDDPSTWNTVTYKLTRSRNQFLLNAGDSEIFFVYDRLQSAWTLDFNYFPELGDPDSFPIGGASFKWDGITYTADQATLSANFGRGSDFTFANGTLQAACWWTNDGCPVTVPDASGPGTLALLAGALGLGFALRRRQQRSALLQRS
jgi:MYXO-CTERM domain-containing protein